MSFPLPAVAAPQTVTLPVAGMTGAAALLRATGDASHPATSVGDGK